MFIPFEYLRKVMILLVPLMLISCGTIATKKTETPEPLRIGINPTYPPLIFKQDETITGAEIAMAREMARALDKDPVFVELIFDQLIRNLLDGQIDIIMSGMSITDARKMRIVFSEQYLKTGQMALMRYAQSRRYNSPESIKSSDARIGVQDGTTGDIFVQKYCPEAGRISIKKPGDAMSYFRGNRIDIFIYDAPAILWIASQNEAKVVPLWKLLTKEQLAFGLRRQDGELLTSVNRVLAEWKSSGKLNSILERWIPCSDRVQKCEE